MTFAELPESMAEGDVAEIYADMRRTLGTSTVALVYRVLAVTPGGLGRVWDSLAPNLGSAEAWAGARTLVPPELDVLRYVPARVIRDADLDREAAEGTIAEFHHANGINFLGLLSLLHGTGGGRPASPAPTRDLPSVRTLPMADLAMLPEGTARLLERMSAPIAGNERPFLIPSLLRCFAYDETLLTEIWRSIGPTVRSSAFSSAVDVVTEQAHTAARALPHRVSPIEDVGTRAIVARFCRAIPGMIVAGSLLGRSLAGHAPPARS